MSLLEILWVRYPALTKNFNVFFVGSPHVVVQARGRQSSRDTEEATQRHLTVAWTPCGEDSSISSPCVVLPEDSGVLRRKL